jgi:hypothetical protein
MNGVRKIAKINKNKHKTTTTTNVIKTKQKQKAKYKTNLFTIYELLKLICTCKWSIYLSGFDSTIISFYTFNIRVISLATGKMVLDLARVTTYPETDGTINVKIKLVINLTPQIAQI